MNKRVLIAGVLGAVAMYLWSFLAHMVLPLGTAGVSEIPNEQGVLTAMQAQLGTASGLYLFPGMGLGPSPTRQEQSAAMQQYDQKLAVNPSGILIYHPPGAKSLTPGRLGFEFITELLEASLLAFLMAQTSLSGFGSRMGFVLAAAIMAAITTNLPYWNWYGFPTNYIVPYMTTQIVGYLVAGLVVIAVMKPRQPALKLATAA